MTKRLQDLFVLNERVALLGRWRFGFFGMVPVGKHRGHASDAPVILTCNGSGATNVGSIRINFDEVSLHDFVRYLFASFPTLAVPAHKFATAQSLSRLLRRSYVRQCIYTS